MPEVKKTMKTKQGRTRVLLPLGIVALFAFFGCSRDAENVLTGTGLDAARHRPTKIADSFQAGESFSIVLAPVRLEDSYLDLIVYSFATNGEMKRSRSIGLKGLDTTQDYLQISNAFSIPFPGKYRISFEQLGQVKGYATVKIE